MIVRCYLPPSIDKHVFVVFVVVSVYYSTTAICSVFGDYSMAINPKPFKPTPDQVKLIIRGLSALSDIDKRAEKAAAHPAIQQVYADEQVQIAVLTNAITSSELEL